MEGIHGLSLNVRVVGYSHVRRTGNKLAHILAWQAQSFVNDVMWIEEIPCYIQQALIHDVLGSWCLIIFQCVFYKKKKKKVYQTQVPSIMFDQIAIMLETWVW